MENSKLKEITIIILCGGKGSRLGALGKKIPKTLAKVQNKEILWYILNFLKYSGFKNIILPLGYKGKKIQNFLKKYKFSNLNIETINTGVNTNIGKRLYLVRNKIKSENILLLNGDAIFKFNLKNIYKNHCKKKLGITFLTGEVTYAYGSIGTKNGKIIDFKRNLVFESLKTKNNNEYLAYNYTGMSIIQTKLLRKFKNLFKMSENFEQDFYPKIIKKYHNQIVKIKGLWHSIDNIKDLDAVNKTQSKSYKFKELKNLKSFLKNKIDE
jgi:glucose-1-phosphate cytidylyltransferase|tara:strand:- start:628 stop:1431 length:804 start_codon:yes stop_codon:yes gene_type:complete